MLPIWPEFQESARLLVLANHCTRLLQVYRRPNLCHSALLRLNQPSSQSLRPVFVRKAIPMAAPAHLIQQHLSSNSAFFHTPHSPDRLSTSHHRRRHIQSFSTGDVHHFLTKTNRKVCKMKDSKNFNCKQSYNLLKDFRNLTPCDVWLPEYFKSQSERQREARPAQGQCPISWLT